jgi:hypothetical protein
MEGCPQVETGKPRVVRLQPAEIPELAANLVETVRRVSVRDHPQ